MATVRAAPIPLDYRDDIKEYNRLIENYVEKLKLRCNPLYINKLGGFKFENELRIQKRYGKLLNVFDLLQAQERCLMVIQMDSLEEIVGIEQILNAIEGGMVKVVTPQWEGKKLPDGVILTEKVLEAMYGKP